MAGGLIARYRVALAAEPKLRAYLAGAFLDDVGVAVSGWASRLLFVSLFTDQHQRARLMMPTLLCFLLGTLVAGPLADWVAEGTPAQLARWRWKVVVWGRLLETAALGLLIAGVADHPTLASVAPYAFVSAFMKTVMRPTRIAFHVDLLREQAPQVDATGLPLRDERGAPLMYKTHLLAFDSLTSFLNSASLLGGLLLGGQILAWASGRYVPLFVFDVATNLAFIAVIFLACHPDRSAREARLSDLGRDPHPAPSLGSEPGPGSRLGRTLHELRAAVREVFAFLAQPRQRPLLILLTGSLLCEWLFEFYDGGMIVKQVLHGTDEDFRYIELGWTAVTMVVLGLLPALARWVAGLGKLFAVAMLVDGAVMALAGVACGHGAAALLPVAVLLGLDRALSTTSSTLADLAQNSASSSALRGRLAAVYALVAILGDIGAEGASTALTDAFGTGGMLLRIGLGQVAIIGVLAALGGRRFWSFGLRAGSAEASVPALEPTGT